jgi:acetyl esterase/lipase
MGRVARLFGHSLLLVFAVATLGSLVPTIPVLGSIGPLLISPFGPWITILSLAGAVAVYRRWRKIRGLRTFILAALAAFATIGTVYIQAQQIAVARANGVDIDLAQILRVGPEQRSSAGAVLQNYGSHAGQPLPLAIYPASVESGQPAAPILVYVHGGGWGGGSLHDRVADMRWFADRGFLVISVEYTLSSTNRPTWDLAPPQIGCALAWITNNAARYDGDASRLALFGESAGGNIVLNVSYMATAGSLQPSCPGELPRIAATVAAYPILDAVRLYQNDDLIAARFARQMALWYTGGKPADYPGRYAAVSPVTHIHPAAPPTLLLPGLADHLLPPGPVFEFAAKAIAAGVEARVIAFPYGEHSFDQRGGSIGSQFVRQASLQFLELHGLVP